jgi:hypothetical protein
MELKLSLKMLGESGQRFSSKTSKVFFHWGASSLNYEFVELMIRLMGWSTIKPRSRILTENPWPATAVGENDLSIAPISD